jgi:hypothetical protein
MSRKPSRDRRTCLAVRRLMRAVDNAVAALKEVDASKKALAREAERLGKIRLHEPPEEEGEEQRDGRDH